MLLPNLSSEEKRRLLFLKNGTEKFAFPNQFIEFLLMTLLRCDINKLLFILKGHYKMSKLI